MVKDGSETKNQEAMLNCGVILTVLANGQVRRPLGHFFLLHQFIYFNISLISSTSSPYQWMLPFIPSCHRA